MVPPMVRLIFPVSFLLSASAIMGRSMTETEFENTVGNMTMDNFLQDNGKDRNVLFGRLLAVYDYMEQRAMYERDENGKVKEGRTTNAKRYWNAYSSRPARTSKTIRENLIAYERKLNDYERKKFEEWTGEIMTQFAESQFDNTALTELYLPGYYQQIEYMKKSFQKKDSTEGQP